MDSSDSETCFMDELLNFSSDIDEEEVTPKRALASSLKSNGLFMGLSDSVRPWNSHELVEEELEWISNKDAFPAVESFMGVLPGELRRIANAGDISVTKDRSPVSVLDGSTVTTTTTTSSNSSTSLTSCFGGLPPPPRRARTQRRGQLPFQCWGGVGLNLEGRVAKAKKKKYPVAGSAVMVAGRKCQHCGADKTPQWRAGPAGPKTLCNACGVRFKSGRLVPEYRPASSPTFSPEQHSNSHRKIVEMRRVKQGPPISATVYSGLGKIKDEKLVTD